MNTNIRPFVIRQEELDTVAALGAFFAARSERCERCQTDWNVDSSTDACELLHRAEDLEEVI